MADSKISALTATTALATTDELAVASAGASKKITGANLKAATQPDFVCLQNQLASGSNGGSSTGGSWQKAPLNTTVSDTGSNVSSLTSSVFVLVAGTYEVDAKQVICVSQRAKLRLRNTTDGTTLVIGLTEYNGDSSASGDCGQVCELNGVFTVAASKNIELQYWVGASQATNGLGVPITSGEVEVYTSVILRRRS